MKLPDKANLTDKKYEAILKRIKEVGLKLEDIEEKFVRGGGRGGQKINKTSNAVQLKHGPTGTVIKFQKHRERGMNRIMALRELLDKLHPEEKVDAKLEKIRKQKARRKRRSSSQGDS